MKNLVKLGLLTSVLSTFIFASGANDYKRCIGCHGVKGEKVALESSLVIKDMTKKEVQDSIIGYQKGTYGREKKALMKAQVSRLTPTQIEAIANYIGK